MSHDGASSDRTTLDEVIRWLAALVAAATRLTTSPEQLAELRRLEREIARLADEQTLRNVTRIRAPRPLTSTEAERTRRRPR